MTVNFKRSANPREPVESATGPEPTAHALATGTAPSRDTDTSMESATRVDQIERIETHDDVFGLALWIAEQLPPDTSIGEVWQHLRPALRIAYDAGLRSQPASEPSLDVERTVADLAGGALDNYDRLVENGWSVNPMPNHDAVRDWIAARLSQPADNEAAE